MTNHTDKVIYRPFIYILFVFAITWLCIFLKSVLNYEELKWIIWLLDFIESASPLIVSLFLLRKYLSKNNYFLRFFVGINKGIVRYIAVTFLFILQFLNFYLFKTENTPIYLPVFLTTFAGQFFLGGALEEGGWRGYLQPAFEKKLPVALAVVCVSLIWACWHLPYFFMPDNMHAGSNFLFYIFTTIVTGFILTAIYKLTESVLLCTLFHGWQNTIVMSIQTNMGHPGFMIIFILLGIISLAICLCIDKKKITK